MFSTLQLTVLAASLLHFRVQGYRASLRHQQGNTNLCLERLWIFDTPERLNCSWNSTACFAECSKLTANLTSQPWKTFETNVSRPSHTRMIFSVQWSHDKPQRCLVAQCVEAEITTLLREINGSDIPKEDLMTILTIRKMCQKLFTTNRNIKKLYIIAERKLILKVMEIEFLNESFYYNFKQLSLVVVNITQLIPLPKQTSLLKTTSNTFPNTASITSPPISLPSTQGLIMISAPQLFPENETFIPHVWMPQDALSILSQEKKTLGLVTYLWPFQFQFANESVGSMVIRIELSGDRRLANLSTPIRMQFNVTENPPLLESHSYVCQFFQEHDSEAFGWRKEGCETVMVTQNRQTLVECSCDHTTPFAVLLLKDPISSAHWTILSYFSYVGCGLSAFFCALSVLNYIYSRTATSDPASSIHVSLSGALFLLNTSFLLSEWGATLGLDWVCVSIAATMHYSLLCCFTWMALEALHLYLMLVKVFNTYYRHYMVKLSLVGWGIPCVIVGVTLAVKNIKEFYGATERTLLDSNQTNTICWVVDETFFLSVNLSYLSLVFLLSSGVLITVSIRICWLQSYNSMARPAGHKRPACKEVSTVLGLSCLLGTSWGMAFLSSGHVNYPLLYLFCIFNSLQGFFIFLWMCGMTRKKRQRAAETS